MSKRLTQPVELPMLSNWLHWGITFLLIAQIVARTLMERLGAIDPDHMLGLRVHGVLGLLILLATLAHIVIHLCTPHPIPEGMRSKWNFRLHGLFQWAIYIFLLLVGISSMSSLSLNHMSAFAVDPVAVDPTVPTIRGHILMVLWCLLLMFLYNIGLVRYPEC